MKRSELLRSRDFWIGEIQNELYAIIEDYIQRNKLTRSQLADELGVTKGYISQILKGDFDHKLSKLVDLAMHAGKVPLLFFEDIEKYIKNDTSDKVYELMPMLRGKSIEFVEQASEGAYANEVTRPKRLTNIQYKNQPIDMKAFAIGSALI